MNLDGILFRTLTEKEEKEFRMWSRSNYIPGETEINPMWHPVIREECTRMLNAFLREKPFGKEMNGNEETSPYAKLVEGLENMKGKENG